MTNHVRAYAPGSIGNVGPGIDILGLSVAGRGDVVLAERSDTLGVRIKDAGHADLPTDPERHCAAIAAREVLRRAGASDKVGLDLSVTKGLPIAAGQGGSAASAVAAAVATNGLLHNPLWPTQLVGACLMAEEAVSGRHADNIAASLFGGMVLLRSLDPMEFIKLPVPHNLRVVLALPNYTLETSAARACLPSTIPLEVAMHQAAQVAAIVAACYQRDLGLLGRALEDRIAEPARADLLPGFREAKLAAINAGALGVAISGAGPTVFAVAHSETSGHRIGQAMGEAYHGTGMECNVRVAKIDHLGARLIPEESPVPQNS